MKPSVTYIFRKRSPRFHSIEELFYGIMNVIHAQSSCQITPLHLERNGATLSSLRVNILTARRLRSGIIHITGDVHYVSLGCRRPTVLTIHDTGSALQGNFLKRFFIKLLWFWLPALCVDRITVISEYSKQEVVRLIPFAKRKIRVIPNPCNSRITYSPGCFNVACPRILHLGTKPNKNLDRTIEALVGIPCELVIVGELSESQHSLLIKSGISYRNEYHIPYERIIELYRECDLVCFASTYEGFGLPILEAQATGRPVITSSVASMPEVAGEGALLVDPLKVEEIRSAINRIISDERLRADLIAKGLENIKRFSPESVANQYIELYNEISRLAN